LPWKKKKQKKKAEKSKEGSVQKELAGSAFLSQWDTLTESERLEKTERRLESWFDCKPPEKVKILEVVVKTLEKIHKDCQSQSPPRQDIEVQALLAFSPRTLHELGCIVPSIVQDKKALDATFNFIKRYAALIARVSDVPQVNATKQLFELQHVEVARAYAEYIVAETESWSKQHLDTLKIGIEIQHCQKPSVELLVFVYKHLVRNNDDPTAAHEILTADLSVMARMYQLLSQFFILGSIGVEATVFALNDAIDCVDNLKKFETEIKKKMAAFKSSFLVTVEAITLSMDEGITSLVKKFEESTRSHIFKMFARSVFFDRSKTWATIRDFLRKLLSNSQSLATYHHNKLVSRLAQTLVKLYIGALKSSFDAKLNPSGSKNVRNTLPAILENDHTQLSEMFAQIGGNMSWWAQPIHLVKWLKTFYTCDAEDLSTLIKSFADIYKKDDCAYSISAFMAFCVSLREDSAKTQQNMSLHLQSVQALGGGTIGPLGNLFPPPSMPTRTLDTSDSFSFSEDIDVDSLPEAERASELAKLDGELRNIHITLPSDGSGYSFSDDPENANGRSTSELEREMQVLAEELESVLPSAPSLADACAST